MPVALRDRLEEALRLAKHAANGDAAAEQARRTRMEEEIDPRVRSALDTGEMPTLGKFLRGAPRLAEPARLAEPGTTEAFWLTSPDASAGVCRSRITVAADGQATVDTLVGDGPDGPQKHVRYRGWAWRDAEGNLVIDARGQQVENLLSSDNPGWDADSMVVKPDGKIETVDDRHRAGLGSTGAGGNG